MSSTSTLVPISQLPVQITYEEAVEAAYREEIDWATEQVNNRLSVLIKCDKQLANYLYKSIRRRMRGTGLELQLLSGHPQAADPNDPNAAQQNNMTLSQRLLGELRDAIYGAEDDKVLVMTHLDILTTTTSSGLGEAAREVAAIMYENPDIVFLTFVDHAFEIPKVIERVFTAHISIGGVPRDKLNCMITQREARKFGVTEFNPYALYKYISGLNAVRARQVLNQLVNRVDYDPAAPHTVNTLYADIRKLTLEGGMEIPRIDLDRDIGGYKAVKDEIKADILDLLVRKDASQSAEEVKQIESIVPRGMIFEGPPGTGKTYFAKAIATALNATVTVVSGPEMKSKWVGESEENLRRIFSQARKAAPSVIIFDEIDSFATARGTYTGSGVEHSMVNQLLTEMDGFRKEELVFVIATTNFAESLDPALLRPGRFEKVIEIPYPLKEDRRAILDIYTKKFDLEIPADVMDYMVELTGGVVDASRNVYWSGDHLYALMRSLKRDQIRRGKYKVTKEDVQKSAGDKKPVKLSEEERRTVAVHEAGHAILAYTLPHIPTVKKITISSAEGDHYLGFVMQSVSKQKHIRTQHTLRDSICVALGGRAAELMINGVHASGCWNDLQQATAVATLMVEQLGMGGDGLEPRAFKQEGQASPLLGGLTIRNISDDTAVKLDTAIRKIMLEEEKRAAELLAQYRTEFNTLVDRVLVEGTLKTKDIEEIFGGRNFKAQGFEEDIEAADKAER